MTSPPPGHTGIVGEPVLEEGYEPPLDEEPPGRQAFDLRRARPWHALVALLLFVAAGALLVSLGGSEAEPPDASPEQQSSSTAPPATAPRRITVEDVLVGIEASGIDLMTINEGSPECEATPSCARWFTSDELTFIEWDAPGAAEAWASTHADSVVVGTSTTVQIVRSQFTPDQNQALDAAIAAI